MSATDKTITWCVRRGHPWVTYNPWMNVTFCRCGKMREPGRLPIDMQALLEHESPERLRQLEHVTRAKLALADDPQVIADETDYLARIRQALTAVEGDSPTS